VARITLQGIEIEYELLGKAGDPAVVVTVGGRFSKDIPGSPELGRLLAEGGRRVLLWDRPNCGASDLCFDAENESILGADILRALLRQLDLGPAALVGGSAGSRLSMIAAARNPEMVSHLVALWMSGGPIGLLALAHYYCVGPAIAASKGGMQAVASSWQQEIARNPRNREILLRQDPKKFIETMGRWAEFFVPPKDSPVPGMSPADFARLKMPALVFRSGESDLAHPRRTSEWVHALIPGSRLVEPPWGDNEWNERSNVGEFCLGWPKLAPQILEFLKE
jgi:pimeloyl-ACP methyl ester carboxylesterase